MPGTRGAALDYLEKRFGGLVEAREFPTTVGAAAVLIVPFSTERVFLTLTNLGAADIYVAPSTIPTANRGIRLTANGGLVSFTVEEDALMPCLEWQAYGLAAGLILYTIEVKRFAQTTEATP